MTLSNRLVLAALLLTIHLLPTASFAQVPDITATKTDSTPAATKKNPGETVTYTNVISNAAGAGTATGLQFTDPDVAGSAVVASSVKVSPIAFDDTYTGVIAANTTINTATSTGFNVLTNDFKGLAAGATATLTISTTNITSTNGGTVVIAAGGTFTYSPAPGFVGTDSFNYTITNNSGTLSNTGSVSLTVSGPVVWYVNDGTGDDTTGNGTLAKPFATLTKAATVDAANHKIFVATGTYAGTGITLESNEMLIGQGSGGGTFDAFVLGLTPTLDTIARPILGGTRPTLSGGTVITLAAGNTIRGVNLNSTSAGSAISGSNIATATIGGTPVDTFITSTSASSSGVNLNGGTGAITIHAPIHATAGIPLSIANRTGGTVTINGKVSSSGSASVLSLATNGATVINLHSVVLSTGFSATGSGTVSLVNGATDGIDNDGTDGIDEADEANTIATTGGTALNLNGVTVGAGHLTFQSISSTGGSAAGIIIRNTSSSPGTVFVTGTGSAGTGGTIQNKTGADVSTGGLRTPTGTTDGTGIYLASAGPVSLDRMNLQTFSNFAVYANGATNFKIDHSTISGTNGENPGQDEGGMRFLNLAGSCSLLNSTFGGNSIAQVVRVVNTSGTLNLTVNGSTFTNPTLATGDDGLFFEAGGTATITANVFGNTFTANRGDHFQAAALNSGNLNISFKGNTLIGGHATALGSGVTINAATGVPGYAGTVNYDIDGNTISGAISNAVIVNLGTSSSAASFNGFVRNNLIGTVGSAKSGSLQANGIGIDAHGNGTHTCAVTGNTVIEAFDRGISVLVNDGTSGILNLTVQSNDLDQSVSSDINGSRESFFLNNGSTTTNIFGQIDAATVRLNFGGAGGLANLLDHGVGSTDDFRVRQRFQSRIEMPGYAGTPFDNAAVVAYLTGRNTLSGGATASATSQNDGGSVNDGYFAASSVPFPSATPLPLLFAENLPEPSKTAIPAEDHSGVSLAVTAVATMQPATTTVLQAGQLDSLVAEAITRWEATGLTAQQSQILRRLRFELSDLDSLHLGQADGDLIRISQRAAGNEWFIDSTPSDDAEFSREAAATRRAAMPNDAALNRVDLLTTLLHEMGHALGLCDSYSNLQRDSLMYGFLSKGERRLPSMGQASGAVPHEHNKPHFLAAPIDIGVLPPGKSVTVIYDVVISDPLTTVPLTSQGTVSGSNFTNKLTDDLPSGGDPALPGTADPTVTLIERPDTTVATLSRSATNPTNASSVTWQIVFAHPLGGLTAGNFSLAGTGLGGSPSISGVTAVGTAPTATWNITATSGTGDGILGLNLVNDGALTFDVTNQPFTGQVYTIDRTQPTVAINQSVGQVDPAKIGPVNFTVAFSESMNGFASGDVTLGGTAGATTATVTEISPNNGTTYNVAVTGMTTPGTITVSIAASVATDLAGNNNTASASTDNSVAFDDIAPTVSLTSIAGNPATNAAIPVTAQFSETVSGFIATDISAGNATVGNFTAVDGDTYTFDLTPSGPGVIATADISAAVAQDAAGNDNTAAAQFSRTIVDAVSVATINAGDNDADESGNTGTFTFTRGSTAGELTADFQLDPSSTGSATDDFTLTGSTGFNTTSGAGTVTFPDGQAAVTLTLNATAETLNAAEAAETVRLNVVAQPGIYAAGSSANATVTIAANGFIVTTTADSGEGSLRQAVANANAIAGTDAVTFGGGTFTDGLPDIISLSGGQITISTDLTISGPGADLLTVRNTAAASTTSRVLLITAGTSTVRGMKISGGNVNGVSGGGIRISPGTLTLIDCAVVDNSATEFGGGIRNNNGTLNVVNSTVSGNIAAGNGAAGGIDSSGSLTVTNTTISGNSATDAASSSNSGGIYADGPTTIRNSTVTNNFNAGTGTSGVLQATGVLTVANSIIAGNQNNGTKPDVEGTFVSSGNNLIGNVGTATGFTGAGDQKGSGVTPLDPLLGSLADNGGPTQTHALLSGSPAFNAGNATLLPADTTDMDGDTDTTEAIPFDQRGTGFARSVGVIDIGSFEAEKFVTIIADAASKAEGTGSGNTAFTFTVTRTGGTTGDLTLNYAVSGAVNATDFGGTLPSGSITIPDSQSSAVLTINAGRDSTVEPDEAFTVTLSNPSGGYVIATPAASSIITNDDFEADLAITVTDGLATAIPGGTVTYTIVASNSGPHPATGATLVDTFPASLTNVTWTATGAGGGTVTAAGSGNINDTVNLPVGASVTYTVNATIAAAATGTLANTATVSSSVTDPVPGNNSATDTDTLTPRADLAITKTDGVATAIPGGSVTYTITASNSGLSNVVGATLADTFPAALTATWTAVGAGGGTAPGSGSGNINALVNLPAGGSVTFTVSAGISPAATGSLVNTATISAPGGVTDPNPGNNSATDTDTLTPRADLAITKTDGVATAVPGNSVTYTITASNAGPSNVAAATVADTLPASIIGATWTATGAGGGIAPAAGSGNINALVNLPAGGSVTYTVTAPISAAATGTLVNTATVSSAVTDPVPANNSATDTDTLVRQADLSITKTDGVTNATPGGSVTYTIVASNAGPSNVTTATVADTLPASIVGATWTAVGAGGGTAPASGVGNIFHNSVNLPAGGSITYTVIAPISAAATGTLSNTATVGAPPGVNDPNSANNSATDTDTLTQQANLAITKTDGVTTATPGGSVTYTITASNSGPSNVTGANVADTLPAIISGATWTASGAGGGTATAAGAGNINDTVNLPVGGSVTYTVTAPISAAATGTLVNTATVSSAVTDPNSGNNSATDTDTLTPQADLAITKTDGVATAVPGNSVTYTITASNPGPSNVNAATVADTLPGIISGATWTATGAGGGTATAAGSGNINDTVNLPVGGSVTYTVIAPISSPATGTLVNTATVSSTVTDPNPGNNSATDTDTLTPQADLAVTISDSPDPVNALGNITYTINLTNNGPSTAVSPGVGLLLPTSTTFVSASAPGGWSSTTPAVGAAGSITFSEVSLATGGTASFTVVAKVDIDVVNDSTLTATATATTTTTDPAAGNNSATAATLAKSGADLQISLADSPDPVVAGTELTYTVQITNNGPLAAENVSLADTLPAGTVFVSLSAPAGWTSSTPAVGSPGSLTVTRPILANGETATFTLVVGVNADVADSTVLTNTATTSSTVTDIIPGNNAASTTSAVITRSDLEITLTGTPAIAPKDTEVTYQITIANQGPSDSNAPVVSFPIPSNMTFVSAATPAGWSASTPAPGAAGTVAFSAVSLANGATAGFTVVAKVDANTTNGTILIATATASEITVDPVAVNNSRSTSAAVGTVSLVANQPVTTGITVNPQTGLFDVIVYVTNTTPLPINGFRLHVNYAAYLAAHPSLRLYNASSPAGALDVYIEYPYPVAVDGVVPIKLSFYTNNRRFPSPFQPGLTVEKLGVAQIASASGEAVQPTIARSPDQSVLLEFPAVAGKWYRVRYSPDLTNWFTSEIPVQATGNLMQWIDSGPPFTNIPPANAPSRFYLLNEIPAP